MQFIRAYEATTARPSRIDIFVDVAGARYVCVAIPRPPPRVETPRAQDFRHFCSWRARNIDTFVDRPTWGPPSGGPSSGGPFGSEQLVRPLRELSNQHAELRMRRLEIHGEAVLAQLIRRGRPDGADDGPRQSGAHVGLEPHPPDDLPEVHDLHA